MQTSKGEQKIIDILNKNRVCFKREIIFEDLTGKKKVPLRFDFGIYRYGKLFCLIEFDGIQHYEYVKYFHKTTSQFKKQQEWDRRKNSYCIMHNIPLIRIPYWDLDTITLNSIFTNTDYRVKSKYHNDLLFKKRCK